MELFMKIYNLKKILKIKKMLAAVEQTFLKIVIKYAIFKIF